MKKYRVLNFFSILLVLASELEARAVPGDSQELAGINIGGLHADLKTNLFSADGPLAQFGNAIASGASQLQSELTSGAQALQTNLQNAKSFLGQGSQQKVAGINIGGLHADLKTNLFSSDGPLAQLGNEIASGASQLQGQLTSGAQAMQADMQNAKNSMTDFFGPNGPLAQLGNLIATGASQFQNELTLGAQALQNFLQNARNSMADLFGPNGPLAQLGIEISSGASQLLSELDSGAKALQNELQNANNFWASGSGEEIAGINLGGLHADFKTNLFAPDGPLAQLGNEISSGASQLQSELTSGTKALEADLQNAKSSMASGGFGGKIAGINLGGLHADLKTNLFAPDGPLAQLGNQISSGASQLQSELTNGAQALQMDLQNAKNSMGDLTNGGNAFGIQLQGDLANGGNAFGAGMTGAANSLQTKVTGGTDLFGNGFQNLGLGVSSSVSGGASLNGLFSGANNPFSTSNKETDSNEGSAVKINPSEITETISGEPNQKSQMTGKMFKTTMQVGSGGPGQESFQIQGNEAAKAGNELLSMLQGANGLQGLGGSYSGSIDITGQTPDMPHVELTELFKNIQLPSMCGSPKGISNALNPENLLEPLTQGLNSLPKLSGGGTLSFQIPKVDFGEVFVSPGFPELPPLPLHGLAMEEAAEAFPVIAGLSLL